jgi:hypothetical protein
VITSYKFAAAKVEDVLGGQWDLVVFDEAHRLRNVYRRDGSNGAKALRDATRPFFELLLTPERRGRAESGPFLEPVWALSADFSDQRILGQLNIFGSKGYARC